jgi:hypothetical protein
VLLCVLLLSGIIYKEEATIFTGEVSLRRYFGAYAVNILYSGNFTVGGILAVLGRFFSNIRKDAYSDDNLLA